MRIQHGVALTLDDQIDALETAWHELGRIMLSSGFNMWMHPECAEIFPFDDFSDFYDKLFKIWQKLEELKKERDDKESK